MYAQSDKEQDHSQVIRKQKREGSGLSSTTLVAKPDRRSALMSVENMLNTHFVVKAGDEKLASSMSACADISASDKLALGKEGSSGGAVGEKVDLDVPFTDKKSILDLDLPLPPAPDDGVNNAPTTPVRSSAQAPFCGSPSTPVATVTKPEQSTIKVKTSSKPPPLPRVAMLSARTPSKVATPSKGPITPRQPPTASKSKIPRVAMLAYTPVPPPLPPPTPRAAQTPGKRPPSTPSVNHALQAARAAKAASTQKKKVAVSARKTREEESLRIAHETARKEEKDARDALALKAKQQSEALAAANVARAKQLAETQALKEAAAAEATEKLHTARLLVEAEARARKRHSILFKNRAVQAAQVARDRQVIAEKAKQQAAFEESKEGSEALKLAKEREAARRRQSIVVRGDTLFSHKEQDKEENALREIAEQNERALQEGVRMDVNAHIESIKALRRKSMAYRCDKAVAEREARQEKEKDQIKEVQAMVQTNQETREDIEAYNEAERRKRRMSMASRRVIAKHDVVERRENEAAAVENIREEVEENHRTRLDFQAHAAQLAQEYREDLEARRAEEKQQREQAEVERLCALEREEMDRISAHNDWQDIKAYKNTCKNNERESLDGRRLNNERIKALDMLEQKAANEHKKVERKYATEDWQDIKTYENDMYMQNRLSLEGRRVDHKRIMHLDEVQKLANLESERESHTLMLAGHADMKAYEHDMYMQNRKSLENRRVENKRIMHLDEVQKHANLESERESHMLMLAGRADAKNYENYMYIKDRESLDARREEFFRHKSLDENEKLSMHAKESADRKIYLEERDDVHTYVKMCELRDRESLEGRRAAAQVHKEFDILSAKNDLEIRAEEMNLANMEREDVDRHMRAFELRDRLSLESKRVEARAVKQLQEVKKELGEVDKREENDLQNLDRKAMLAAAKGTTAPVGTVSDIRARTIAEKAAIIQEKQRELYQKHLQTVQEGEETHANT